MGSFWWILEGDIKACFDEISHDWLLAHIPMDRGIQKKWLQAGYLEGNILYDTDTGTPQGGIISPTLANMALDGLAEVIKNATAKTDKVNFVRYADDFIVTGASQDVLEQKVKPAIVHFLSERGLELSEEKTLITHIDQGFDFLGFNVRKYNGKLLIKPAKQSVKALLSELRDIIKSNPTIKTESLIRLLNPKLRGWANYYRHVVSKATFSYIDHALFDALCRWIRRRHRDKSAGWMRHRYFKHPALKVWNFHARVRGADNRVELVRLIHVARTKIVRHVKIRAEAMPYDPAFIEYFERRRRRDMPQGQGALL